MFHLLAILVKVVLPEDMSTCLMRFSNVRIDVSSTLKNAFTKKREEGDKENGGEKND